MEHDFRSRVVVVTGGTKGIGAAIARAFHDRGATVIICARQAPESGERARVDGETDSRLSFVQCNVRDTAQVDSLFDEVERRYGRLDVLVNNAGGSPEVDAATVSPRFHAAIIDLNLTAPLNVAQRANALMQRGDGGLILNICSVSGVRPSPKTAAYGAAKAGLISLTRSLAVEWAPKVRMNAVVAGLIATEQSSGHYGDAASAARIAATVPLGRFGTPDDVAGACLFLASDHAAYISGASIQLDGGGEWPAFLRASDAAR